MYFLVNASPPKLLDICRCIGVEATLQHFLSKVKKPVFAMVYYPLKSSYVFFLRQWSKKMRKCTFMIFLCFASGREVRFQAQKVIKENHCILIVS